MDLAVRHNSLVNEPVRAEPAPSALASTALDESPRMFSLHRHLEDFGLLHLHLFHCWLDM